MSRNFPIAPGSGCANPTHHQLRQPDPGTGCANPTPPPRMARGTGHTRTDSPRQLR
ncbi:MAG TPA: hypothetical protein V6D22_15755 [Candidatus Obscuribacterales bacterium]